MDQNNNNINWKGLFTFGAVLFGAYALSNDNSEEEDTINYRLKHRGKIVYEGICYEDRYFARMAEHRRNGLKFDSHSRSKRKPRSLALDHEESRIRRNKPRYNAHHNS